MVEEQKQSKNLLHKIYIKSYHKTFYVTMYQPSLLRRTILLILWQILTYYVEVPCVPGESKKARCLMERGMKTRSLISKIGIVFNLR